MLFLVIITTALAERTCTKSGNQITCGFYPSECWCLAANTSTYTEINLVCWNNDEYYSKVFNVSQGSYGKCSAVKYATPPTAESGDIDLSDYVKFSDLPVFINESFVRDVVESTYARINSIPECCSFDYVDAQLSDFNKSLVMYIDYKARSTESNTGLARDIITLRVGLIVVGLVVLLLTIFIIAILCELWEKHKKRQDTPAEDSVYSLQSKVGTLKDEINWLRNELGKRGAIEMTAMQPWCEEEDEPTDDETESYYSSSTTSSTQ